MQLKEKAAIFVIIFSIIFTVVKFIFYYVSGSIAVLSEAWHSFTDLITSIFVLIAIKKALQEPKNKKPEQQTPIENNEKNKFYNFLKFIKNINPEIQISIVIGFFLFVISILLFRQIFVSKGEYIHKPVITGLVFLFFSGCLYFLYRFKFLVGEKTKSQSLIADAYHSKADMVSSLITGFILILYYFGINLDKLAGFIISINILSFSIEVLFNSIRATLNKQKKFEFEYSTITIIGLFFNLNILKKILLKFNIDLENKKTKHFVLTLSKYLFKITIFLLLIFYLSTCIYTVNIGEVAFIERLGNVINKENPVTSGLHFKLPLPFDKINKINVKEIQYINIGNYRGSEMALIWSNPFGASKKYISGDNNFFLPYITLLYDIKDPYNYLYKFKDAKTYLKNLTENLITSYFASISFYDLILFKRSQWIESIKNDIQNEIDNKNIGIHLVDFIVNNMHPPSEIAQAFEQVIASYQKKEQMINNGYKYQNQQIPLAKSENYRVIYEAKSYKTKIVAEANGNLVNFKDKLEIYSKAKNIVKNILYNEKMEEILSNKELYIIDSEIKNFDLYMNFPKFTVLEK